MRSKAWVELGQPPVEIKFGTNSTWNSLEQKTHHQMLSPWDLHKFEKIKFLDNYSFGEVWWNPSRFFNMLSVGRQRGYIEYQWYIYWNLKLQFQLLLGAHPFLQATYTGVRTTVLVNIFFLSFLAETKREPPFSGHFHCEFWPHSFHLASFWPYLPCIFTQISSVCSWGTPFWAETTDSTENTSNSQNCLVRSSVTKKYRIRDTCFKVKDHGYKHHSYLHHKCMHQDSGSRVIYIPASYMHASGSKVIYICIMDTYTYASGSRIEDHRYMQHAYALHAVIHQDQGS